MKFKLRTKVKEMELESRSRPATPNTTYNMNIYGDNYGNAQQGGVGNTQNVNTDRPEVKPDEEN